MYVCMYICIYVEGERERCMFVCVYNNPWFWGGGGSDHIPLHFAHHKPPINPTHHTPQKKQAEMAFDAAGPGAGGGGKAQPTTLTLRLRVAAGGGEKGEKGGGKAVCTTDLMLEEACLACVCVLCFFCVAGGVRSR